MVKGTLMLTIKENIHNMHNFLHTSNHLRDVYFLFLIRLCIFCFHIYLSICVVLIIVKNHCHIKYFVGYEMQCMYSISCAIKLFLTKTKVHSELKHPKFILIHKRRQKRRIDKFQIRKADSGQIDRLHI